MGPQQAKGGRAADTRSDVWAFGCVLFEMLTGRSLFAGETISDTVAAVLKEEPDLARVPARVRRLLQACLRKDPKQRLHSIDDARLVLGDAPEATAEAKSRVPWALAAALAVDAALALCARLRPDQVADPQ
jgi:serine/threonine-protein kinase